MRSNIILSVLRWNSAVTAIIYITETDYKILIDLEDFKQIVQLFKNVDLDKPYASSYDEVLALLTANDVDFILDSGNTPGVVLALMVAQHHTPKVKDLFNYIT